MNFAAFLFIGIILVLAFYPDIKASIESDGVFKFDKGTLRENAKVINVHSGTVGSKIKKRFRVVVQFDDGSKYIKVVNPGTTDSYVTMQRITLYPQQQTEIVEEAINKHNSYLHDSIAEQSPIKTNKNQKKEEVINKIVQIVNDVFIKLNEYMINNPNIILDTSKQKQLEKSEEGVDITNTSKCDLVSYYCAVIEYWSGKKELSNRISDYFNDHYPVMKLDDPEKQAKIKDMTKHLIEIKTATHIKRMSATKGYGASQLIIMLGENF